MKQLANENGWHRWTAHRLLLERQDQARQNSSVIADLKSMAMNSTPEARNHALWLLAAYSALEPADAERALKDGDPRIRRNALQMSEPLLARSLSQQQWRSVSLAIAQWALVYDAITAVAGASDWPTGTRQSIAHLHVDTLDARAALRDETERAPRAQA